MTATPPDRRLNAYRPDLADIRLRRRVTAERFVAGTIAVVAVPVAPLRSAPRAGAALDSELLFGEPVRVFEARDGWAWVQSDVDGYVGYTPESAVGAASGAATHRVTALATFVYPRPDIKAPTTARLPFGARLHVAAEDERFVRLAEGGYVCGAHVVADGQSEADFVTVAERFAGVPYLWGGRSSLGLDCSGLVQTALHACGRPCPRDSDMQEAVLGRPMPPPCAADALRRGDLIFWRGHVAIATGDGCILHANAHHMAVAIEEAEAGIARIAASGSAITSIRRLPHPTAS